MSWDGAKMRNLTVRQRAAIVALLVATNRAEAANRAGVSERTLTRYLADPTFRTEYRTAARDAAETAVNRILGAQERAIDTLLDVMGDGTPAARQRAARAVLEVGLRLADEDIDRRLSEVERRLEERRWHD